MNKAEVFRIKQGKATCVHLSIEFDFGIIFEEDGIYTLEFYSLNSISYLKDQIDKLFNSLFSIKCLTTDNDEVEVEGLRLTRAIFANSEIWMTCYNRFTITKKKLSISELDSHEDEKDGIYYLEVEGLKMAHTDFTEQSNYRGSSHLPDKNWNRDCTSAGWTENRSLYNLLFFNSKSNDHIIIKFDSSTNSTLTYQRFIKLKSDFIALLSFLNGANVRIRKEYTGNYYSVGGVDSHKEITYSFKSITNINYNEYIPLNEISLNSRKENIINNALMFSFDKFTAWNKHLQLSSIIFYLNNASQAASTSEQFFIQIIAFEKLTSLYSKLTKTPKANHPSQEEFEPLKNALIEVLETYKPSLKGSYHNIKSRIGNLNANNKTSTTGKMFNILNDAKIEINTEISTLINEIRNDAIHEGEIGENGYSHTILLNELIQEIILRMIEYKGIRLRSFLYDKLEGKKTEFVKLSD